MRTPLPSDGLAWLEEQGVSNPALALSEAGFAPFRALENARGDHLTRRKAFLELLVDGRFDPVEHAASFDANDLPEVLGWLQKWAYDLAANRLAGRTRYNIDFAAPLRHIASGTDLQQLSSLNRSLVNYQSRLGHPLNPRLIFEYLFVSYLRSVGARCR
jgi:DNA polymerase-3 subunit delta'